MPTKGSHHSRSEKRSQSLSPPTILHRQRRLDALDQPPLISIPDAENPVTLTDQMRSQRNRFVERMQPILIACVGGATLVAPRNYIPISDFRNTIKKKLRLELMGRELIMPSHSQEDLVIRHYSLEQLLWKPLTFNTQKPDIIIAIQKDKIHDQL